MDILQRIINMDKAAAARVKKAVERETQLSDEQGSRADSERDKLVAAERVKIDAFIAEQEQKLSDKLACAEKTRAEQCGELDERFNAHKAAWKSEIFARITEEK